MTVISADFLKGRKLFGQFPSSATSSFKSFKVSNNYKDPDGLSESEFYLMTFAYSFKTYFGFEYVSWLDIHDMGMNALSTYPEQWVDLYLDRRLQNKDTIVLDSAQGLSPFFWSSEFENKSRSQEVNKLARQYGILTGITIPMDFRQHGVTALSFSSARPFKSFARTVLPKIRDLLFLSYLFQMMIRATQQNISTAEESDYLMSLYKEYLPVEGEIS